VNIDPLGGLDGGVGINRQVLRLNEVCVGDAMLQVGIILLHAVHIYKMY
jgi:hypothetical protein